VVRHTNGIALKGRLHPGNYTMDEDDLYYGTKTILRRAGINVFGGELLAERTTSSG